MFEGGDLLATRYRLLDKIGEGGAAEVFRARDERLNRIVAIKLLRPQFVSDEQSRIRFENEAKAAAGLSQANIVDVYDVGDAPNGGMFIAMQYVDGENLKEILQHRGRLSPAETISIAQQVCHALSAAHASGIIHRDVKPQNTMIDASGNVKLTDFGVAKALSAPALTQSGMTFGTAAYLSPEQATGQPVGPPSDLYSLGCVMYEMLSGSPPFTGDNPAIVAYKQVWEQPRPLHDLVPEVLPSLETVVMRLLSKDPDRRFPSAGALAAALEQLRTPSYQPTQAMLADTLASASAASAYSEDSRPAQVAAERSQAIPMAIAPLAPATAPAQHVPPVRAQIAGAQASAYVPQPFEQPPPAQYAQSPPRPLTVTTVPDRRGLGWLPFALVGILLLGICGIGALKGRDLFGAGFPVGLGAISTPTEVSIVQVITPTATTPLGQVVEGSPVTQRPTPLPPTATPVPPTDTPAPPTNTPPPTDTPVPSTPLAPTDTPVPPQPTDTPESVPATNTPVLSPPPEGGSKITLDDTAFTGGATRSNGSYHGRTAHWVYGQGTQFHTMSTSFNLAGEPTGMATLTVVGLDSEDPDKTPIRISINDVIIYEGPDPLPDDSGPSGPGNWGSFSWQVNPGVFVGGANTMTISNLSPSDKTNYPLFFMLDYAVLSWGR